MPCIDGRERVSSEAMDAHHRRVEEMIERWIADGAIPRGVRRRMREEYEQEVARMDRELQRARGGQ